MRYLIYIIFPLIFWSCEQTGYDNPDYQLVFSDEFRGESIDESVWNFEIGTGCQYGVNLDGWGNFENQYYLSVYSYGFYTNILLIVMVVNHRKINFSDHTPTRIQTH